MKRFRYSIRTLMGGVVLMGVAFAGLRSPTPFWANLSFSLVLAGLVLAVPTAVYRRGERRAFWVGFATFGWVYFVLTLLPWFETEIGFQLFSTTLLDLLAPYVVKKELLLRNYVGSFNPPFDPVAPFSLAALESPGAAAKRSLADGICDADQPGALSPDRPRGFLRNGRVSGRGGSSLPGCDAIAGDEIGAPKWKKARDDSSGFL